MAYSARILADSLSPDGIRLITYEVTFPRIVLAEFNTHRVFSRNSASSRAIPVATMLKRIQDDPFIPIYWGKNQKGMQAAEELPADAQARALAQWLQARDHAVETVKRLQLPDIDLHKQIANRLLEPWLWQTVLVTATEWDNWDGLRDNSQAQPEIQRIAGMMKTVRSESIPLQLSYGEWHLPLVSDRDQLEAAGYSLADIVKICVGRCCRVSYLTHDGKRDPLADIELFDRLLKSGHMSPFEHAARPMTRDDAQNIIYEQIKSCAAIPLSVDPKSVFCGNFRGWISQRKLIPGEAVFTST